jgi:hypothetical protein
MTTPTDQTLAHLLNAARDRRELAQARLDDALAAGEPS